MGTAYSCTCLLHLFQINNVTHKNPGECHGFEKKRQSFCNDGKEESQLDATIMVY